MNQKALGTGHRASGAEKAGESAGRVFVGRSRGVARAVCVLACGVALAAGMTGCEWLGASKVTSPYTQQPATGAEIEAQRRAEADKAALAAREQADRLAANLKAEADTARAEQARRKAALDRAVASLDAETRVKLAELQAEYEIAANETTDRLARMQADTERAVATIAARTEAKLGEVRASGDAALARIAEIDRGKAVVLDLASSGASLVPGYGDLLAAAVTGLGGVLLGRVGRKAAEDKTWDEATREANAARDNADRLYDEGKRESEMARLLGAVLAGVKSTEVPAAGTSVARDAAAVNGASG
ncbi:MAG: hypothetical protein ACKVZJ_10360 [Phycisphaerales bacterium]